MKIFIATMVFLVAIRGAEALEVKLKVDLVNASLYTKRETGQYYLGLKEVDTGDIYLLGANDKPIRADAMPNAMHLQTAVSKALGKHCLMVFLGSRSEFIDWHSFVKSAVKTLTPTELMALPDSIWAQLNLNQIAKILGRIPDDDFVRAMITKLEQKGRPVHTITSRATFDGRVSCKFSEGNKVAFPSTFFETFTMDGEYVYYYDVPAPLIVRRKLFKNGTMVSRAQLLFVFSELKHKW